MTIGQAARRAGLRPSAIRFYEAAGLLPSPQRRPGGQRRYDPAILQWLAVIRVAQEAGFTIDEIRELFSGVAQGTAPSAQWRALAERKLPEVRALIQRAQEMERWLKEGLRCDCLDVAACRVVEQAVVRLQAGHDRPHPPRRLSGWQRQKRARADPTAGSTR
ncbi:MAG: MerR family transcriptional regulator [Chloroflexota bacterium]|nr:MerR family transcriptional regulator [Chloroflexota bacterium]